MVSSDELMDADRPITRLLSPASASRPTTSGLQAKVDAARTETDVAKRKALYDEITQNAYDDELPRPLLNIQDVYGVCERLDWQPRVDAKLIVKEMKVNGIAGRDRPDAEGSSMGRFILRRFGQGLLVVLGVSLVVFVAMRVFGDPAKVMLPL